MYLESFHNNIKYQVNSISNSRTYISQGIELLKIIFSCDWDFFSTNWEKNSPKSHWEWGLFSAPETPEKNPCSDLFGNHICWFSHDATQIIECCFTESEQSTVENCLSVQETLIKWRYLVIQAFNSLPNHPVCGRLGAKLQKFRTKPAMSEKKIGGKT